MRHFVGPLAPRVMAVIAVIAAIAFAPGGIAPASGQTSGALKGIAAVKFFIGDFNDFSVRCGLEKQTMREAFVAPMEAEGLPAAESSAYWIFIRATTLTYGEESCITNIDASLLVSTRYFNPASATERPGKVQLWTRGGLLISGIDDHGPVVTKAFGDLGKALAEAWRRDQ